MIINNWEEPLRTIERINKLKWRKTGEWRRYKTLFSGARIALNVFEDASEFKLSKSTLKSVILAAKIKKYAQIS